MTDKLIECVKKHPYLYDSKDPSYKNMGLKNKVWKEIAEEMGVHGFGSAEVIKIKWKSLRDNYGRYKKEMADPIVQVKKFIRWPWANHLQFLDEAMDREKFSKGRSETPPPMQFLEISMIEQEMNGMDGTSGETNRLDVSPPATPSKVLEESSDEAPPPKRIKTEPNSTTQEPELDAVDHLFKSYAQTFKTFTKRNQITLKVELAQLFADIEAKEMIGYKQV